MREKRKRDLSSIEGRDAIRQWIVRCLFVRKRQINDFNFVDRVRESRAGIFGHYYVNRCADANRNRLKVGKDLIMRFSTYIGCCIIL